MKPTQPIPPAGLLDRCLNTIPVKPGPESARFAPDAGSRTRLRWLSVAAAIPVLSVLLIIPLAHLFDSELRTAMSRPEPSAPLDSIQYIRKQEIHYDLASVTRAKEPPVEAPQYELSIFDRSRGIVSLPTDGDWKPEGYTGDKSGILVTKEGGSYRRYRGKVTQGDSKRPLWALLADQELRRAGDTIQTHIDWGKHAKWLQKNTLTNSYWKGRPVRVLETEITSGRITEQQKRHTYTDLERDYIDRRTGRCLAEEHYIYWQYGPKQKWEKILTAKVEYFYDRRPGDEKYFDLERFKQGW